MGNPLCGYSLKKGTKIIAIADIILFFLTIVVSTILIKYTPNSDVLGGKDDLSNSVALDEDIDEIVYEIESLKMLSLQHGISSKQEATMDLIIFGITWSLLVGYILLEIWLCCTLIRGAKEGSIERCTIWFWWRLILIIFTAAFTISKDFAEFKMNYSDLSYIPLHIFRIFALFVVYHFILEIKKNLILNVGTAERKLLFILSVAASVTVEHFVCHRRPIKISIYLTSTEFHDGLISANGTTIWDYLTNSYDKITTCVPSLSYLIYTSFLAFLVGYLIVEIWMCCLLLRAAKNRSLPTCRKWITWRLILLIFTFVITACDVAQMQYTCTDLAILPLNAFRAVSILVVYLFMKEMCIEDKYTIRIRT